MSTVGGSRLLRIEHGVGFEAAGDDSARCRLVQAFEVSRLLAAPAWGVVRAALARFGRVGEDLCAHVAAQNARGGGAPRP